MAFIGIFLLSMFGMMIFAILIVLFIFIVGVFIFVFIPALIVSIINLVLGIKHHWPKVNIILLSIFGSITIFLFCMGIPLLVLLAIAGINSAANSGAAESVVLLLTPLLC